MLLRESQPPSLVYWSPPLVKGSILRCCSKLPRHDRCEYSLSLTWDLYYAVLDRARGSKPNRRLTSGDSCMAGTERKVDRPFVCNGRLDRRVCAFDQVLSTLLSGLRSLETQAHTVTVNSTFVPIDRKGR